jgi:glycosyltransferase involved in cell wall biosynthesis
VAARSPVFDASRSLTSMTSPGATVEPLDVTVIVPVHDPHAGRLRRVLAGLRAQTLDVSRWETIVVDNASSPPIDLRPFVEDSPRGVRVVTEPRLGLSAARRRGFAASRGAVCVLVDDDNILAPDYLTAVVRAFAGHPEIAVCGGKSLPEFERPPAPWQQEFLSLLALRDLGDEPRIAPGLPRTDAIATEYPNIAPIGAGMAIRREAAMHWTATRGDRDLPDRTGTKLASSGDNDIVLSAIEQGGSVAYLPELVLTHLIPAGRLDPAYLARLNRGIQKSWMQVLSKHGANPWPPIAAWTVSLRQAKAWVAYRAWTSSAAHVRWQGACGHFEGRVHARREQHAGG